MSGPRPGWRNNPKTTCLRKMRKKEQVRLETDGGKRAQPMQPTLQL